MPLYDQPKDPRLHQLVREAVRAANEAVSRLEDDRRYIGTHFDFPKGVRIDEHGWPSVTTTFGSGPTDYGAAFGPKPGDMTPIGYWDVSEMAACIEYVLADEELRLRAAGGYGPVSDDDRFASIGAAWIVTEILDRARHEAGEHFSEEVVDRLYLDIEPAWVLDELPVAILVPILLTKFDIDDRLEVLEGVSIERMDDGTNRARAHTKRSYSNVKPFLLEAATHALVLERYTMPAVAPWQHRLSFWPVERIDKFFRALEIVEDVPTGFGEIIYRPLGWARNWRVDLPPLVRAVTTARYPPDFEDGGWNTDGARYSKESLGQVGETFAALERAPRPVEIAARRLGSASLRARTDDNVIDLCIGLEALFGERGAEITHKLATRVATVMSAYRWAGDLSAYDVFRAVKQVYGFRSRVVHGEEEARSKRVFIDTAGNEHDVVALAREALRGSIASVLARPDLLRPGEMDRLMLSAAWERFDADQGTKR